MDVIHLTSSTFFGGPERQMLGLAEALADSVRTTFVSFPEDGKCETFLAETRGRGFEGIRLQNDSPKIVAAVAELTALLRETSCDTLVCHGYKANIIGRIATRRAGIPAVAVSRGWTGEDRRVRLYEWLDRRAYRQMDHIVCVSDGQARKVRRWCRVPADRITVVRNSARLEAFSQPDPSARAELLRCFPGAGGIDHIVLAAGRLSPEKGFFVLLETAASLLGLDRSTGVALFGEGPLRAGLEQRTAELRLRDRFVMPGFRPDLDRLIAAADVVVLPSFTEGLPNVALEASAAGVPVVATDVGGTPEVVADGETGILVPPGEPTVLAARISELLRDSALRGRLGAAGRQRMRDHFTFEAQASAYSRLFATLCPAPVKVAA
jgi:glycosyltransferase involved in cell wall biosynthesis